MPAISLADLNNAKTDVDHIAAIATSAAGTATDRLGNTKQTLSALIAEFPTASANAASALSSAASAAASEAAAGLSETAAEAARDAANALGKVFTSTALGIAGTVSGQSFSVLSADLLDLIVYTNNAGVADELLRYKTKAYFRTVFDEGFMASRVGYLYAWVDSTGALLLGIKTDGTLWSKGVDLSVAAAIVADGPERCDYLHIFTDSSDRIIGGFLNNGDLEVKGVNVSQAIVDVPTAASYTQPLTDIVIYGDSLTEGAGATLGQTMGVQLEALYAAASDTRTVTSSGYGGQSASAILSRLGPVPALVTLPTGASGFPEIPAAASAVNVTMSSSLLAYSDATQTKSILGTLAGIPGTLSKAGTTLQYSFTRTTAGSIVVTDSAIPFVPDTAAYRFWTLVCWIGTNNLGSATAAQMLEYIDSYLSWQVTIQKRRVVVMPAIDCLSGSVATLQANYASLLALVKAAYPYEYIDTLSLLQRNNDGSVDDLADVAAGLPPRSLLAADRYHLNSTGYGVVAADIKRIFDSKGY
jgi:lysophospholipase L1-like esterase